MIMLKRLLSSYVWQYTAFYYHYHILFQPDHPLLVVTSVYCAFYSLKLHPSLFFFTFQISVLGWAAKPHSFIYVVCVAASGLQGAQGLLTQLLNWNNGDMTKACCGSRVGCVCACLWEWVRERPLTNTSQLSPGWTFTPHIHTYTTHSCRLILWSLNQGWAIIQYYLLWIIFQHKRNVL